MNAPDETLRARDQALARLQCPACTGMIVPEPGDPANPFADVICLDCSRSYRWSHGVLDLVPPDRRLPARRRNHGLQGDPVSFYDFFAQSLSTQAYADTDVEDQLYHLLDWLDYQPGEPVLILGSGEGEHVRLIGEACADSLVLALDDDLRELSAARSRQLRAGLPGVFVRCDLNRPPIRPGSFGAVLHFGILHTLPEGMSAMLRLGPLLPPGARIAGVCLARSTLPQVARSQDALEAKTGFRFVAMDALAQQMVRGGWLKFRHEQPSNWMARFMARKPR